MTGRGRRRRASRGGPKRLQGAARRSRARSTQEDRRRATRKRRGRQAQKGVVRPGIAARWRGRDARRRRPAGRKTANGSIVVIIPALTIHSVRGTRRAVWTSPGVLCIDRSITATNTDAHTRGTRRRQNTSRERTISWRPSMQRGRRTWEGRGGEVQREEGRQRRGK